MTLLRSRLGVGLGSGFVEPATVVLNLPPKSLMASAMAAQGGASAKPSPTIQSTARLTNG